MCVSCCPSQAKARFRFVQSIGESCPRWRHPCFHSNQHLLERSREPGLSCHGPSCLDTLGKGRQRGGNLMLSSCDQLNLGRVSGKGTLWLEERFVSSDFRAWLPFGAVTVLSTVAEDTAASLAVLGQISASHETGAPLKCVGRASLKTSGCPAGRKGGGVDSQQMNIPQSWRGQGAPSYHDGSPCAHVLSSVRPRGVPSSSYQGAFRPGPG